MLIPSAYKGVYEKVLRAPDGRLVRVTFAIVEVNGALRGRVISMEPVLQVAGVVARREVRAKTLYLPISVEKDIHEAVISIFRKEVVSPYTTLDFFMSQPTRAPSSK
jgi:hypothetical protein